MARTDRRSVLPTGAGLVAAGAGLPSLAMAGTPWPAIVFVIFGALLLGAIHATFPQRSEHRLRWWRDRRKGRRPGRHRH